MLSVQAPQNLMQNYLLSSLIIFYFFANRKSISVVSVLRRVLQSKLTVVAF